jgi:membrane protease YdiL (CAAX protease family)
MTIRRKYFFVVRLPYKFEFDKIWAKEEIETMVKKNMSKSGQTFVELIKRKPVESFFILATVIMFGLLFPAIYLVPGNTTIGQITGYYLARISVYSPVIAGFIVTRLIYRYEPPVSFYRPLKVFIPAWIVALIIQVADLKLTAPPQVKMVIIIILAAPVSLLPAWIIVSASGGSKSIRNFLSSLIKPRGAIIYYLIALLTFPVIHVIGSIISNISSGQKLLPDMQKILMNSGTVLITFLSTIFFAGGINEESGWRGFAQKRLQARYSPLVTVLILWIFMVIWHIPNDILQYSAGGYLTVRILLFPFIIILFSWVFNRTKGSILAVVLFHASMNSMNPLMGLFPITMASNILIIIFALSAVLADKMWRRLPSEDPAVNQE